MKLSPKLVNLLIALLTIPLIGFAGYLIYKKTTTSSSITNQNCIVSIYKQWPDKQLIKRWIGTVFGSTGVTVKHIFDDFESVGWNYIVKNGNHTITIKNIYFQSHDLAYFQINKTRLSDCMGDVVNDYKLYNKWSWSVLSFDDVKIDGDSMIIADMGDVFDQGDSGSPLLYEDRVIGVLSKKNMDDIEVQLIR